MNPKITESMKTAEEILNKHVDQNLNDLEDGYANNIPGDPLSLKEGILNAMEEYAKVVCNEWVRVEDTVWEALYNPMYHESAFCTLSLHKTKEGAEKAVAFHKMEKQKEHEEIYKNDDDGVPPFNEHNFELWDVREIKINP